jgi:hypothetical protein
VTSNGIEWAALEDNFGCQGLEEIGEEMRIERREDDDKVDRM